MAKHAGAGGLAVLPIAIIIVIVFSIVNFLPVDPTLTAEFRVGQSSTSNPSIAVNTNLTSTFYFKQTIIGALGVTQGQIRLSRLGAQNGTDYLNVTVSYSGVRISSQNFTQIGDGNYRVQVVYGMRSESSSIPYIVTLTILSSSQTVLVSTTVTLYP